MVPALIEEHRHITELPQRHRPAMETADRVLLRYLAGFVWRALVRAALHQLEMQGRAVRVLHFQHFLPEPLVTLHDLHVILREALLPEWQGILGNGVAAQRDLARSGARFAPSAAPREAGSQGAR